MKKYFTINILLFFLTLSSAQNTVNSVERFNKIEFYTPEALSLMRYIDYPVSAQTGIPDINIPLHNFFIGDKEINMKLMFHMDNFLRINELPGSVGGGWSLNTDYQITRVINGLDDFGAPNEGSGYYEHGNNIIPNYTGEIVVRNLNTKKLLHSKSYDGEPDKFYYNIPGKSGSFYFQKQPDNSMKVVTVPYDGVKITYSNGAFTLIDTDGYTYTFSEGDRTKTQSPYTDHVISWKCNKIVNASGREEASIKYDVMHTHQNILSVNNRTEIYDDIIYSGIGINAQICLPKYYPDNDPSYIYTLSDNVLHPYDLIRGPQQFIFSYIGNGAQMENYLSFFLNEHFVNIYPTSTYIYPRDFSANIQTQHLKLISEITFRSNKILFGYTNNHILSSIKIMNGNECIKNIDLTQINYNNMFNRTLSEININDEKYTFNYGATRNGNTNNTFWGYNSETYLPQQYIDVVMGNQYKYFDCTPATSSQFYGISIGNADIFKIGNDFKILTINYPTGGRSEFLVEQNRFLGPNNTHRGCGGYRIKKIQFFADKYSSTPLKEKIYKYGENENGGGTIKIVPTLSSPYGNTFTEEYKKIYHLHSGIRELKTFRKRTFLQGTCAKLRFDNGSPIVYDKVTEYESNGGVMAGKTVFSTNLSGKAYSNASGNNPYPLEPDEWYWALPDSIIQYKYTGNGFEWVQKKSFSYKINFDPIQIFRERVFLHTEAVYNGDPYDLILYPHWSTIYDNSLIFRHHYDGIKTGVIQQTGHEILTKDKTGNIITETVSHFYNTPSDYLPSQTITKNSDNLTVAKHIVYPKDYTGYFVGEGATIESLIENNIVDVPIEQVVRRNGKITDAILNLYHRDGKLYEQKNLKEVVIDQSLFKLSNKNLNDFSHLTPRTPFNRSNQYTPVTKIIKYDIYNNPICVQDIKTEILTWYIWSYMGQYPIAEIVNATEVQVINALNGEYPESLSTLVSPNLTLMNNLHNSSFLVDAKVSTYIYKPLVGVTSKTDPNGLITYYEYDSFGRLEKIKDHQNNIIEEYKYHYKP